MVREIEVLIAALSAAEARCLDVSQELAAAKRGVGEVDWERRLAISALRRYLREILGSEVVDAFMLCVPLAESSKWRLLSRLATGEECITVVLVKPNLLVLEVRRVGGGLAYRAWRTPRGKGILFKEAARGFVSQVEDFLGQEVPFEVEED